MKITEQYQNRSSLEAWEVFIYFDLIAHRSLLYLCVTQQIAFGIIYTWISVSYLWEFHANLLVFFDVIYYRVNFFFFFLQWQSSQTASMWQRLSPGRTCSTSCWFKMAAAPTLFTSALALAF